MKLPQQFIRVSGPRLTTERYRGLRGLVRYLTEIPERKKDRRNPIGRLGDIEPERLGHWPWGTCKWCGMSAERSVSGRPRKWHDSCLQYAFAAQGSPSGAGAIRGEPVEIETPYGFKTRSHRCPACGKAEYVNKELDHIMAIGVAWRLGLRFYRRAFLPENLWWICEPCHRAKTAFDRAFMRSLDNPVTADEETTPIHIKKSAAPPPTPLFDWAEEQASIAD